MPSWSTIWSQASGKRFPGGDLDGAGRARTEMLVFQPPASFKVQAARRTYPALRTMPAMATPMIPMPIPSTLQHITWCADGRRRCPLPQTATESFFPSFRKCVGSLNVILSNGMRGAGRPGKVALSRWPMYDVGSAANDEENLVLVVRAVRDGCQPPVVVAGR